LFRRSTSARELVATVRANVTIDWTVRDNVRAQLRVLVKRILRKHGYPPDKQERATQTVLEQALRNGRRERRRVVVGLSNADVILGPPDAPIVDIVAGTIVHLDSATFAG
jgi:hypothetical protein